MVGVDDAGRGSLHSSPSEIVAAVHAAIERNPGVDVIFIHDDGTSGIVAAIVPIESWSKLAVSGYSHDHIAGDDDDE